MSEAPAPVVPSRRGPVNAWVLGGLISLATGALLVIMVLQYTYYWPSVLGREQPIPFSHRFHVSTKQLSCMLCHPEVIKTPRAGVPPVETCMLCHQRIAIHYPQIAKLRQHYYEGRPVRWVRVHAVPEFVYFNHQMHIRAQFDCGKCHGDVARMDRIVPPHLFKMGFCVKCHREEHASADCYTCHR